MTKTSKEGDNPVIGNLTFKHKLIQRKYDAEVIWDDVESGVEIRNKDTIRTGDYSDALLTLLDSSKININENSMIYLDFSESAIINFAYGSLSLVGSNGGGALAKDLKITSGDKVLEIGNSSINLEKKGKDDLKLEVKEGKAKIIANGKETLLNENEVASVKEGGIEVSEITLFPESPLDLDKIYTNSTQSPIEFTWSTTRPPDDLKLEIAKDSKFLAILQSLSVSGKNQKINLDPGLYFWRLSSKGKSKTGERELSTIRKFQIYTVAPPEILSPEENKNYKFSSVAPLIDVKWKSNELYKDYIFELSNDPNFSVIINKQSTHQNRVSLDSLTEGKYFIRITAIPFDSSLSNEISKTIPFTLENATIPDPPSLVSPQSGQKFYSVLFEKNGSVFQWKDSPEYKEYTFQISNNPEFSKIISESRLTDNQTRPSIKLQPGRYFWRVNASGTNGKSSEFSKAQFFDIADQEKPQLVSPSDNSILNSEKDGFVFQWKKSDVSLNYEFELAVDSEFISKIYSTKLKNNSLNFKIPNEGDYHWRVKILSDDGSEITKSDTYKLSILNLKDPVLISPREGEKIDMAKSDEIVFKWENDSTVDSYAIEIYSQGGGSVKSLKLNGNSYTFRDLSKLEEGNFTWSLEANFRKNNKEFSSKKVRNSFKIYLSDKPNIPSLRSKNKFYVE